jgi:hypothetical protein
VSVVDLHPEDLLEREAAGELEAADRTRLDAHLARCAPCRLERKLRADFVAELAADSPSQSFGLLAEEAAVEGRRARESMVSLRDEQDGAPASTRRPSVWPRRRSARAAWLLAAAALLVGSVATAMGLSDGDWRRLMGRATTLTPAPAPTDVAPPDPPRAKIHRAPAPLSELPAPIEAVASSPEPVAPAPPARVPAPAPRPLSISVAPPVDGPAELLDSESTARRHGEYARALDIHRDLESRYPASREAQVSRAVAGRLLLDRSDPARALANFESYLAAGTGDLREETMVGRATALDRLGRDGEAARAWRDLLTAFPGTPYALHARARSESLNSH